MRGSLVILVLAVALAMALGCSSDGGGSSTQNDGDQPYTFAADGGATAAGAGGAGGSAGSGGRAGAGVGGTQGAAGSGDTGGSGADAGSNVGGSGSGGDGGTGDPVPDTALFVPDVEGTYVGSVIDPGLEIVAHSIEEGPLGLEWLVVLENVSADLRLCTATMETTFLDASGTEVAVSNLGIVRSPLKRGCSGTCGFMNCLNPGEIGMIVDPNGISDADVSRIASFTYSFGALNVIDAEPTTDATVSALEVFTDDLGATRYRGMIVNHTSVPFDHAGVYVFGLTAAGRPLLGVSDFTPDTIAAFGSWSFETLRFDVAPEDIATVVAFPEVSEP